MFLRKSARAVAAAAALTLAAAVPAIAAPEDPETPETLVAALAAAQTTDDLPDGDGAGGEGVTLEGDATDGDGAGGEDATLEDDATDGDDADDAVELTEGEPSEGEETPESADDSTDVRAPDASDTDEGAELTVESLEISPMALPEPGTTKTFTIANITDFHGRLDSGVAERLACYVDLNPDAILTSSGDNIGASLFISSAQNDYPTLDVLNAMGVQVSALGNHELDRGWADFANKSAAADCPYVAANISGGGTTGLDTDGYTIETVGGVNVAFVGAVTTLLPELISPSILTGVSLDPIAATVNSIADSLKESGEADVVIALVHEDPNVYIGDLSTNVDAVFGGHSHLLYTNGASVPTLGMQAASYGTHVSQVDVTIDSDGNVTFAPENVPLATAITLADCAGTVHAEVKQIVAEAAAEAEAIGSQPLGYVVDSFQRAFSGPGNENRGEESTVGSLVADAQLWAAQQTPAGANATLSFMNPGGLRTDLKYGTDGLITLNQAATMQPFANTLFAMDLKGSDVIKVLEQQLQPTGSSRPYLHMGVSGLRFFYDPETYEVTDVVLADGSSLDPAATYRVVTNSFLKDGGDNFPAFTNGTNVQDLGTVDLDAFIDFMGENAPQSDPLDPNGADYGYQRGIGLAGLDVFDSTIETGDEIELDFAGLWYTNGEASNVDELDLYWDGELVESFPVTGSDADLNLKMTNYGRATVSFEVPDLTQYKPATPVSFEVRAGDDWAA